MERDAFLRRVRAAVGSAQLPDVPGDDPGLLVPRLPPVDPVERFASSLALVGGILHEGDPVRAVVEIAGHHGATTFLAWDDEHLVPGVVTALEGAGLTRVGAEVPTGAGRTGHQAGYLDVALGVTGAEAGFAESGSIVVRSGRGRARLASVIPAVHVALLRRADIHRSLAHWADSHGHTLAQSANVVFITGISRTGDIEMRLNTGVHGPAHLHVVLI
jgi:L-lactate dehydrogenase complex protein LldG